MPDFIPVTLPMMPAVRFSRAPPFSVNMKLAKLKSNLHAIA